VVCTRVDVEVWGDLAESAAAELGKGVQVQARALAGGPGCRPAPRPLTGPQAADWLPG